MKLTFKLLLAAFLSTSLYASAQETEFFSTEHCPELFTFGIRAGVNASNHTFPSGVFNAWSVNSWGSGFDLGGVVTLNIRDYLAIQPGFFFESRSGNYAYAADYITLLNKKDTQYQLGHSRSYFFNIPVLAQARFNVSENFRWNVDLGPYFQFKLHASDGDQIVVLERAADSNIYHQRIASTNFFDFGFKMGTGLTYAGHYSFSIHYLAGMLDVWNYPKGGRNKAWTFTLGYDF